MQYPVLFVYVDIAILVYLQVLIVVLVIIHAKFVMVLREINVFIVTIPLKDNLTLHNVFVK